MYFYGVRRHLSLLLSRFSWGQPGEEFLRFLVFFLENLYFSSFLKDSFAGYNILDWLFVVVVAAAGLCVSHPTLLP